VATPKCFITYSFDGKDKNKDHIAWVAHLAVLLDRCGVNVHCDKLDVHLGMDLAKYVETSIRESDFVLLICTPTFAKKVNNREGVVGFENQIIAGGILDGSFSPKQVVPILRKGSQRESIPSYMKGKVYIDFRDDKVFDEKLKVLLKHIFGSSKRAQISYGRKPTPGYSAVEKRKNAMRS
jgi:predicted nucleotide-binding protein